VKSAVSRWLLPGRRDACLAIVPADRQGLRFAKSWNDLSSPEDKGDRIRIADEWMKSGPIPPSGFKEWKPEDKITWLDQNWPLDPPGYSARRATPRGLVKDSKMESGRETEQQGLGVNLRAGTKMVHKKQITSAQRKWTSRRVNSRSGGKIG
jgi:hypothetical protein